MGFLVKDRLTEIMVEFRRLQLRHSQSCQQGSLSDIHRWQDERQLIFAQLKGELDAWCESDHADADLLCLFREIIEGEQHLTRQVSRRRQQLEQGMREMRRGRRVLTGYGNPGAGGRAGFVSSRM